MGKHLFAPDRNASSIFFGGKVRIAGGAFAAGTLGECLKAHVREGGGCQQRNRCPARKIHTASSYFGLPPSVSLKITPEPPQAQYFKVWRRVCSGSIC
jgi:hypothetical protein